MAYLAITDIGEIHKKGGLFYWSFFLSQDSVASKFFTDKVHYFIICASVSFNFL